MAHNNDLGRWGEDRAAEYMEAKGWYVRHRNWQKHHHEIDLVCIDEDSSILLFIEVKTRQSETWGSPDEAITLNKKNLIIKAVKSYIFEYHMQDLEIRYDTISVIGTPDTDCKIVHKEGAFDVESQYEYYIQRKTQPKNALQKWRGRYWRSSI